MYCVVVCKIYVCYLIHWFLTCYIVNIYKYFYIHKYFLLNLNPRWPTYSNKPVLAIIIMHWFCNIFVNNLQIMRFQCLWPCSNLFAIIWYIHLTNWQRVFNIIIPLCVSTTYGLYVLCIPLKLINWWSSFFTYIYKFSFYCNYLYLLIISISMRVLDSRKENSEKINF